MRTGHFFLRLLIGLVAAACATPVFAHPAPFSYLDVRLTTTAIEGTLVLHDFDVAHELNAAPETLLDPATLQRHASAITAFVLERVRMNADGRDLTWEIAGIRAAPERTAVEIAYRVPLVSAIVQLTMHAALFPSSPNMQTFVNVYE